MLFLQPAEKECLAETANNHVALTWTARGFVFACQTPTAAPAPAAGLGLAVRRVSVRTATSSRFLSVWHVGRHSFLLLLSACPQDMYGPDCRLSCKCQNGGVCKRFSGCSCPTGWRGQSCEKSGGSYLQSSRPRFPIASVHHWIVVHEKNLQSS